MGETPDAIREDIELTRERMSQRADALAYKADVPARAHDRIDDIKDNVTSAVGNVKDSLVSAVSGAKHSVSDAAPDGADVKRGAQRARGIVQNNPLGLAVGSVAAGFLVGLLIPATRFENEHIGRLSDDVKDRAKDLGQEALDRAQEVARTTASAATDAARTSGQEQARELADSARETAAAAPVGTR